MDIIDDYRIFHSTKGDHTFFSSSSSHKTFIKIDHFLNYKSHLNKFKRIKIIQGVLSGHSGIKLQISNRKIA